MKVTHHWLREFTALDVSAGELAERLTLAGLEVEALTPVAPAFSGVVVGEVLTATRHPNAEKLTVCEVTTDGSDRLQIICGAPNVRDGLKVAVARVGAKLPDGLSIKRAKLRGLDSNGMLCSARELGLGSEHDGIMELPAALALNLDLRVALDLDDTTLEVNVTPNRGDCMSVFGIARDYSAAHHGRYLEYRDSPVAARHADVFPATIAAPDACPLFGSRVIRGVRAAGPSPAWLRERLRRVGQSSVSPIVDVTNYLMIELGQPLHAYDLARLTGAITVRMAGSGERVTLLNDQEYVLDPQCLVIADERGAVGLAGIMGGRDSAISAATTDVLLESAHFAPAAIAGRARRVGLLTDAAQRFERGVDPTLPAVALERATALLLQIAGGEPGPVHVVRGDVARAAEERGGAARAAEERDGAVQVAGERGGAALASEARHSIAAESVTRAPIADGSQSDWLHLRRSRLARLLGVSVPDAEAQVLLAAVTGHVETTPEGWRVRRPPHRFDLRIEADLIEEIARLRGFDSIVESPASAPQIAGQATESRVGNERLLMGMADAGYHEVITYSFVDPVLQRQMFPHEPALALANAISADLSEMRVSLWPGLIQAARENLRRQQTRVRLFEIGKKFQLQGATAGAASSESRHQAGAANEQSQEQAGTAAARSRDQAGAAHERSRDLAGAASTESREQAGAANEQSQEQAGTAGARSRDQAGAASTESREQAGAANEQSQEQAGTEGARSREQAGAAHERSRDLAGAASTESREQVGAAHEQSRDQAAGQHAALLEVETLAGLAIGARWPEQWGSGREPLDFYDVKNDLVRLFALTGAGGEFRFEPEVLGCLRPGRTARIYRSATPVGWLGEVHPQLAKTFALPPHTVVFEIETASAFAANLSKFRRISKFPSVRRDLAVVVDESVPLAVLRENVTVSASGLLSELRVFDVYRGAGVDSGRKSIALGLILQDSSRTLTDLDADAVLTAVVARLRDELSASIRDQ